ncbi:MAG: DUF1330 domain-containing protein [Alphaproteobacteria bacterium]|nr:DUF1330 domain-containing protein [Alphaproteobacteria bacterium]
MKYENAVIPNKEQMKGFFEDNHGKPISMVNLLKFKDKAEFPEDHELHGAEMTGEEAYKIYGVAVAKLLESLGGEMSFSGDVQRLALGEVEELWDYVAIAKYPSRQAMIDMMMSEEYNAIHAHRDAGLAGQLNIETTSD